MTRTVDLTALQVELQKYGYTAYDSADGTAKQVFVNGTLTQWVQVETTGKITRNEHEVSDVIVDLHDCPTNLTEAAVAWVVQWLRAYEIRAAAGHLRRLLDLYVPNTVAHYAIEDAKRPLRVLANDISTEHVHNGIL